MSKRLFKTLVAVLAIAAAAAGPVRGQNSNPDVTLDFTTNSWGIPEGTEGKTAVENSYTSGGYTITLCGSSGNGYYFSLTEPYILLGKQGAYLQLPAFSSAVDSIHVVGTSGASNAVEQNIYVGDVAVSTATTGMKNVTQKYVIAENYRTAGTIYRIKVTSANNTQIKKVLVYFAQAPAVPHTVRFASGNDGWTVTDVDSARSATAPAVLQNVMAGDSLVVTAPATLPGKVKSVKAVKYVAPVLVSSIVLDKQTASLAKDSTMTLSVASVLPENAADKSYTWSSDNTSVATVNATTGVVTGVAGGTANIIATANDGSGVKDTCVVTVLSSVILDGVTVLYASDDDTWETVIDYNPGVLYQDYDNVRLTSNGAFLFYDGNPVYTSDFIYPSAYDVYQWLFVINMYGGDFYYRQGETWQEAIDANRMVNQDWSSEGGKVKLNGNMILIDNTNYEPVAPTATIDPTVSYSLSMDN